MNVNALTEKLSAEKIEYTVECLMSGHTSFKIGGPADVLIAPDSVDKLKIALDTCNSENIPFMIVGKGSNLLISDEGIDGAVIKISKGLDAISLIDDETVLCGAGASLSDLCGFCLKNGLSGLEFAYGIPGSVGGAVYMNAGAYGGEMRDVVTEVQFLTADGEIDAYSAGNLNFGYRKSIFSDSDKIILSAVFKLKKDNKDAVRSRMEDFMGRRKAKQPLNFPSAGSTFKRPEGYFAGALIEESGLKGFSEGGAMVSEKHAGFVINTGNATCSDVTALMQHIVDTVEKKYGVVLEPEVIKKGR